MRDYNYSIIIPYRDKYDMLLTAVDSIPDRKDIQIIIIDNSEKPLSGEDVPPKNKARVIFLTSSPVKGAGCARNVGLGQVKGDWILFLDADDYFTPNAFEAFDKYVNTEYDIVYFMSDSINLKDGTKSDRHFVINGLIESFKKTGDGDILRYRFVNPIAKMIRTDLVIQNNIHFDEVRVSNDAWFSVRTGYEAKKITADNSVVYMITAGEIGSSLTRTKTKENWFIRYQVMVRINKFLKSKGKYKYRTCLFGFLRVAWKEFGIKEFFRLLKYAYKNKVGIF